MTVQEWIVAIVVLLCAIAVGRHAVRSFRSAKNDNNPCANCPGGCDLKHTLDQKQQKCPEKPKKRDKKCCG